jgi:hypothetical protein
MQDTNRLSEVMVDETVPDQTFKLIGAGPLNRLGNTDFLWQKDNLMNYVWLMASNHYYYSTRLPDTGPDWEIGGIGGYRDYLHQMLLTAIVDPSAASILLNWLYGEERPVIQRQNTFLTDVDNARDQQPATAIHEHADGGRPALEYKVGTRTAERH